MDWALNKSSSRNCCAGSSGSGWWQRCKKKPGHRGDRAWQCVLCCCVGPDEGTLTSCSGSCVHRRSRTYGSCLQQPTRTVTIGHGSPPFQLSRRVCNETGLKAMPSRRGELRERLSVAASSAISHRHWDAGLSVSLYCPPPGSHSRKRLSGNRCSDTTTGAGKGSIQRLFFRPAGASQPGALPMAIRRASS
jgi:hypothetical protein